MNDPDIERVFAESRVPLPDEDFLPRLLATLQKRRRRAMRLKIGLAAGIAVVIGLSMDGILQATASAGRLFLQASLVGAQLLVSPWGWMASLLLAAGLVRRARSWHR